VTSNLAVDLLRGPRGRRTCWAVVERLSPAASFDLTFAARRKGAIETAVERIRKVIREADLSQIASSSDEVDLLNLVADSVDSARYWQHPDEIDRVLADVDVSVELRPVAEAIGSAPASAWWSSTLTLTDQVLVDLHPLDRSPPPLKGARDILHNWKQGELPDEAMGSSWWSPPIEPFLAETSRRLPNLGAVTLLLLEDSCGDAFGDCWRVRCQQQPRVYEIRGANEWTELVDRYALEVTWGREHAWRMATGLDARWFLPDWSRVADDFDVVHLSLSGYLSTSGRAFTLEEGKATFLAGWDPDKSFWLNDVLELVGRPVKWERHKPSREWRVAVPDTD
jgi:hypothetical protein